MVQDRNLAALRGRAAACVRAAATERAARAQRGSTTAATKTAGGRVGRARVHHRRAAVAETSSA